MSAPVYIITGNVGAGKSTYANKLAEEIDGIVFAVDEWMKNLFQADSPEIPSFEWALERTQRIESQVLIETEKLLRLNIPVILDQGFFAKDHRMRVLNWFRGRDYHAQIHYLDVPKDIRWMRVEKRNLGESDTYQFEVPKEIFEFCETIFEPLDDEEREFAKLVEQD